MIFHASQIHGNLIVRADDTDILVLLIGMIGRHSSLEATVPYNRVILDCGHDNNRRMVDVTELATNLEASNAGLPAAVPSFHALTGTDYTSAFFGKGKLKPWNLVLNNPDYIQWLISLGKGFDINESQGEAFVLQLYSLALSKDLNEARYAKLRQLAELKKGETKATEQQLRKFDSSQLPPCDKVWQKKLLRTQYISKLYYEADTKIPAEGMDPLQYGWKLESGHHVPVWYDGSSYPDFSIMKQKDNTESQMATTDPNECSDSSDEDVTECSIEAHDENEDSESSDSSSDDLYSSDSDTF